MSISHSNNNNNNTDRNFDTYGNPSRVFPRIPVTTEQSLNESVTTYDNIHTSVSVLTAIIARLNLTLKQI